MIDCFDKEYAFLSNFYPSSITCDHCKDIKGKNKLGKLLMQVREEIKSSM